MNEQNPPPYHLRRAEKFHRLQLALLAGCLSILVYLLVALDTRNLLTLLLVLIFMALPLIVAFFMVDRRIKYWQSPYQLYSQEFSYKPTLKSGMQVPMQVEYQFPVAVNKPDVLGRIDAAASSALETAHSKLYSPMGYEETRRAIVEGLSQELQKLDIEVFRVRVLKIESVSSRDTYAADVPAVVEPLSFAKSTSSG